MSSIRTTAATSGSLAIVAMARLGGWAWYDGYRSVIKPVKTMENLAAKCNLPSFW